MSDKKNADLQHEMKEIKDLLQELIKKTEQVISSNEDSKKTFNINMAEVNKKLDIIAAKDSLSKKKTPSDKKKKTPEKEEKKEFPYSSSIYWLQDKYKKNPDEVLDEYFKDQSDDIKKDFEKLAKKGYEGEKLVDEEFKTLKKRMDDDTRSKMKTNYDEAKKEWSKQNLTGVKSEGKAEASDDD